MNHSINVGFSFGITSAVVTTLGLMVGLTAGTMSRVAVIGGVITIAIADAMSDALSIHVSEESEGKHSAWQVWQSTLSTFLTKFLFAGTFLIPVLLFDLFAAMWVNIVYGLSILLFYSIRLADQQGRSKFGVVSEHLGIAVLTVGVTYGVGLLVSGVF